jgi:hypothetical protein
MQKVKYLCGKINKEEWSGVLFYSVEGSIRDPANMILTAEDVFLMDKGSSGYTNYSFNDPKLAEYVMSDDYNMNWKIGHIHSHHSMRVFFSGTDTDEIYDNSEFHNYYLSLIVNNFMDREAKIAFRGTIPDTEFTYQARDEDGEFYPLSTILRAKDKVFVINCDIEIADNSVAVPDSFAARVTEILDIKDGKEADRLKEYYFGKEVDSKAPYQLNNGQGRGGFMQGWDDHYESSSRSQQYQQRQQQSVEMDPDEDPTPEDFLAYCLRTGTAPKSSQNLDPLQNVDAALCDVLDKKMDIKKLVMYINDNIEAMYRRFYGVAIATHPKFYEDVLKDCLSTLEEYASSEPKYKPFVVLFTKHHKAITKKINTDTENAKPRSNSSGRNIRNVRYR